MCIVCVLCSKIYQVTCLQCPDRVVCSQTDFQDVNTDKATNVYKTCIMEFKITPTKVIFLFVSLRVTVHINACIDYGRSEDLVGTKLQIRVLEGCMIQDCLAFSVVTAYLSCPLVVKLRDSRDQLCIMDHFILFPMYSTMCENDRASINICKRKRTE